MAARTLVLFVLLFAATARADGDTPVTSLPLGFWYREGHYEQGVIADPAGRTPHFAAIVGSYQSARAIERASRSIDPTSVALGYPWIVPNHDLQVLGECHDSIVVVAGLFATESDARTWRAADAAHGALRIVAIATDDTADPVCVWNQTEDGLADAWDNRLEVTPIDPTHDAVAFDAAQIESIGPRQYGASRAAAIASLVPVCTVPRGGVFVFADSDWTYGWARVRCGGRIAYVPTERTMRHCVVEEGQGAGARLYQVTDVECDGASIDVWSFSRDGRSEIAEQPPTFSAHCGGRS